MTAITDIFLRDQLLQTSGIFINDNSNIIYFKC